MSSSGRMIIEVPTIEQFAVGSYTLDDVEAIRKTLTESFEFGKSTCYIGARENKKYVTKSNISKYYNAIKNIVLLQSESQN